jgi:hypothetical protein
MSNNDKLLTICIIGSALSFVWMAIESYKQGFERGLREGWHRGRAVNLQEFWME